MYGIPDPDQETALDGGGDEIKSSCCKADIIPIGWSWGSGGV